jgi:hypothetical protein
MMILAGLLWAFLAMRMKDREPVRVYPERFVSAGGSKALTPAEKTKEKNQRRKMRKKLK